MMNVKTAQRNLISGSLRNGRSARTVLLRMAADQERAERIKQLKLDHPDLTWEQIAHHVGVTPRAAQAWGKTGSIAYPNAKKLAEFLDVDPDWIMRGPRSKAPDLVAALDAPAPIAERLDRIEDRFDAFESKLDRKLDKLLDQMQKQQELPRRRLNKEEHPPDGGGKRQEDTG